MAVARILFLVCLGLTGVALAAERSQRVLEALVVIPGESPEKQLDVQARRGDNGLVLVGCIRHPGSECRSPSTIDLDSRAALELTALIAAVEARMRCRPPAPAPEDPTFEITTHGSRGGSFPGSLPADPSRIGEYTSGPCAARARLAWWLVRRFQDAGRDLRP